VFLCGACAQNAVEKTYTDILELDLSTIVPSVAGPKRPHDRVPVSTLSSDFSTGLTKPVSFKGYGLKAEDVGKSAPFTFAGKNYSLQQGSVVLAAITSCTNTSNPSVMLGAGLLAKNAVDRGLVTAPFIKTSLAPGSGVVTKYLEMSGLQPYLDKLGFSLVGYGCTSWSVRSSEHAEMKHRACGISSCTGSRLLCVCVFSIGNSGEIPIEVTTAIETNELVASAVLSGNRNFEGRVHPSTRANYLASPPLVVAYAIAGNVNFDFETQPLGKDAEGKDVFLREIWPTTHQIQEIVSKNVTSAMFKEVYATIQQGAADWNALQVSKSLLYEWSEDSTYIHHPPFFQTMTEEPKPITNIDSAYVLLNLGDVS